MPRHERPGDKPARRKVGQDLPAGLDLLVLAGGGHRQRNPDRVADAQRQQLLEGPAGLEDPLRRHPGLGHAQVQRARPGRSRANSRFTSTTAAGSESFSDTQ